MKKVEMEKIPFKNKEQPALNDTNVNKMQENVEHAINLMQDNIEEEIDGVSEILKESNTYSFEETKIGTWVDGRPVYRKVVHLSGLSSKNQVYNSGITDLDVLISMHGRYHRSKTYNYEEIIPMNLSTWETYLYDFNRDNGEFRIRVDDSVWENGCNDIYIIFEYVKIADLNEEED